MSVTGSGIGISAGVPGFRVRTGPRGNYVRVGMAGVSYRATLRTRGRTAGRQVTAAPELRQAAASVHLEDATHLPDDALAPTDADDLVEQLRVAAQRRALWPWIATSVLVLAALLGALGLVVLVVGVPLVLWLRLRDKARRSVVVFYDVTDRPVACFHELVESMQAPISTAKMWLLEQSGRVRTTHQFKTNSGASTIVDRSAGSAAVGSSPRLW